MKENKNLPWARDWKGSCEVQGPGWKGHQCVLRLGGTQPIWSCNTNMMGSVWPQIAQGSGILMPRHTLLHTHAHAPRAFLHFNDSATRMQQGKQSCRFLAKDARLMHARERDTHMWSDRWRGLAPSPTHVAFQIRGSAETLERDLASSSSLILIDKLVEPTRNAQTHAQGSARGGRERQREAVIVKSHDWSGRSFEYANNSAGTNLVIC